MTSETSGISKSASQSTVKCTGPKYLDMGELSREDLTRDNNVKLNIIKTKWENVTISPSLPGKFKLSICNVIGGGE